MFSRLCRCKQTTNAFASSCFRHRRLRSLVSNRIRAFPYCAGGVNRIVVDDRGRRRWRVRSLSCSIAQPTRSPSEYTLLVKPTHCAFSLPVSCKQPSLVHFDIVMSIVECIDMMRDDSRRYELMSRHTISNISWVTVSPVSCVDSRLNKITILDNVCDSVLMLLSGASLLVDLPHDWSSSSYSTQPTLLLGSKRELLVVVAIEWRMLVICHWSRISTECEAISASRNRQRRTLREIRQKPYDERMKSQRITNTQSWSSHYWSDDRESYKKNTKLNTKESWHCRERMDWNKQLWHTNSVENHSIECCIRSNVPNLVGLCSVVLFCQFSNTSLSSAIEFVAI